MHILKKSFLSLGLCAAPLKALVPSPAGILTAGEIIHTVEGGEFEVLESRQYEQREGIIDAETGDLAWSFFEAHETIGPGMGIAILGKVVYVMNDGLFHFRIDSNQPQTPSPELQQPTLSTPSIESLGLNPQQWMIKRILGISSVSFLLNVQVAYGQRQDLSTEIAYTAFPWITWDEWDNTSLETTPMYIVRLIENNP